MGVAVLHIGVGLCQTQYARLPGYNYYITCYLGSTTVEEQCSYNYVVWVMGLYLASQPLVAQEFHISA